ncbi:MAG TPA: GNAT family N-acetyltransferase [Streptosporangiaceae bacterium]|jgi:RimJ/RimL family protein N-acetyltransferase
MPGDQQQTESIIAAGELVLRPVSPAAAAALMAGDFSGVRRGEGWPHEDTMDGLAMVAEGRSLSWLTTLNDLVVGECGTHAPADASGWVEIGYGLAAPYRGQGYGRQMVSALTQWLLRQPDVTGLIAHTDPENTPSRKSLERAGFRLAGEAGGECRYVLDPA